ncbi:MAG: response regulator [Magnetococcales bacterium]|nr:response regulator [Magnetococcales bacterium]NGZ29182.1 response regulator [Magnetococcales bacterium]
MKLRFRFAVIIMTLIVAVTILLSALMLNQFQTAIRQLTIAHANSTTPMFVQQLHHRGEMLARLISELVAEPLYHTDINQIRNLLYTVRNEPDLLNIQVSDTHGEIVYDLREDQPMLGELLPPGKIEELGGLTTPLVMTTDTSLELLTPVRLEKKVLGVVRLVLDKIHVQQHSQSIWEQTFSTSEALRKGQVHSLLGMVALFMVVGILLAFRAASYLSRPVQELIEHAKRLGEGNLETPISLAREDELGILAKTLEGMRRNILYSYEQIRAKNQEILDSQLDLTRIAREKAAAEAAAQAKGVFLTTMSHEIRTPMNVVIGMGDVLAETELTYEQREYVKRLQEAGNNLLELINQILDLSKIEAGELRFLKESTPIPILLEEVAGLLRVMAVGKGLELLCEIHPSVPAWLMTDPLRLRQILFNLLGNAIKFTDSGTIKLFASYDATAEGVLQLRVEDTGIGIAESDMEKIFHPFSQVDPSITRRHGGTGLGLALCQQLVKGMGGKLAGESTPGVGSVFYVILPMAMAPMGETKVVERTYPPSEGTALRILLAEDSLDNQLLIRTYLKSTFHELTIVNHGQEAVDCIYTKPFDLVLMDVQMPVMDGYTATRLIRQGEEQRHLDPIPIVALTAHALEGDAEKSLEAGCNMHITKPIKKQRLLEVIGQFKKMR